LNVTEAVVPDGADRQVAVVTGASSGIGEATARRLATDGFQVVVAARRIDRLERLAAEIGGSAVRLDVTDQASVRRLATALPRCDVLVNNAGGAFGFEPVEAASVSDWQHMYDVNVLGVLRVTQALLPALEGGGGGDVVIVGSTAGRLVYERSGGYAAAKHAVAALRQTLRLELCGRPVRVSEIAPGTVRNEEFQLNRCRGDAEAAERAYAGIAEPLTAADVAECISWMVSRPRHVNVDLLEVRPITQTAQRRATPAPQPRHERAGGGGAES